MSKSKPQNRRQISSIQTLTRSDTDAIAADLLNCYLKHRQAFDEHGFLYLMSLMHNVLLKDDKELSCTHSEMMMRMLPWLEPDVVCALPAIFEHELARVCRTQSVG